ncbi:hypothetical protein BV98_002812 [Sphingobium herbicidovorans NBRC 16415]|uniref:DUF3168 domain-containing protein n=1 Tax=Sphingobium herbicidovorans (strain ATCC 700291 / DSM 11019 / CCUG 56400 / KCTC 2939 / LMG 18315 / NBRC 16415 / MH) TaxID=1219045 RepID=A0A086P7R0_SPHHM|nr:DUF3168 domain-containing protein [Sphingobium herbicidovorans]KFG89428.1 hypothetical protein BV98_002812 [Sphingobium herbicidovorans NBRC 16415]
MSAEVTVRAAAIAALREDTVLMDGLNGLFDGQPVRASVPYAVVGECLASDWGGKGLDGRELRLSISLHDAGETPGRLAMLLGRIEPVVQAADGGEGWRIVGVRLIRSRLVKARDRDGWQAVVDYRLRVVREG